MLTVVDASDQCLVNFAVSFPSCPLVHVGSVLSVASIGTVSVVSPSLPPSVPPSLPPFVCLKNALIWCLVGVVCCCVCVFDAWVVREFDDLPPFLHMVVDVGLWWS